MSKNARKIILASIAVLAIAGSLIYLHAATYPATSYKLIGATTTSVKDTGLMDELGAGFRDWAKTRKGIDVDVQYVGVGTGAAIRMAKQGNVDFILVHAPALERDEVQKGVLVCRLPIAYNFFILVGPQSDPASVSGQELPEAFRRIYDSGVRGSAVFVSRGDDSGTHQKEQSLWTLAGTNYTDLSRRFSGLWYLETGKGMGDTLLVANEKHAYTLTDIGTWLAFRDRLPMLRSLIARSVYGINVYSVSIPNQKNFPQVRFELARLFEEFVTGSEGQALIDRFGRERYGELLFTAFSTLNLASSNPDPVAEWVRENAVFDSPCPPMQSVTTGQPSLMALPATESSELLITAWRSVYVSSAATGLATLWSVPLAIVLAFGRFRYREAAEVAFQALTGVPTVLLGLLFYLLLVRSGPLGSLGILYTTEAMIIASSVLVTPILVSLMTATLGSVGRGVFEAALTLGASPIRAGLEALHDLRVPVAVAIFIAFTRAVGELGIAFMVGGDIRHSTRVLSTAIAFETARGNWEVALLFSGVLLMIVLAGSIISVRLVRRGIRR